MDKKIMIGLGVLAIAGISYYFYKKNKDSKSTSEVKPEEKANAGGRISEGVVKYATDSNIPTCSKNSNGQWTTLPCERIGKDGSTTIQM